MGTRYIMGVTCPECGHIATDCYYAPTCDFVTHVCESCGTVIDLGEYTGISYEDASNVEEIKIVMARCAAGMEVLGAGAKNAAESFEELASTISAWREMEMRARRVYEEAPELIGWILEPVSALDVKAGLRAVLEKVTGE